MVLCRLLVGSISRSPVVDHLLVAKILLVFTIRNILARAQKITSSIDRASSEDCRLTERVPCGIRLETSTINIRTDDPLARPLVERPLLILDLTFLWTFHELVVTRPMRPVPVLALTCHAINMLEVLAAGPSKMVL